MLLASVALPASLRAKYGLNRSLEWSADSSLIAVLVHSSCHPHLYPGTRLTSFIFPSGRAAAEWPYLHVQRRAGRAQCAAARRQFAADHRLCCYPRYFPLTHTPVHVHLTVSCVAGLIELRALLLTPHGGADCMTRGSGEVHFPHTRTPLGA